ncbi:hypothetical protein BD779DRAFT_1666341 [Infundibulicybe gibba]|nr:hypothetical protein BD779DRAFT_1666341 [Infundibulicybe gibba]
MKVTNYRQVPGGKQRQRHSFNTSTAPNHYTRRLPIYRRQKWRFHPYPRNVPPIHLDLLKIRHFLEEDEVEEVDDINSLAYFSDIDPVELAAVQVRAALRRENQEQEEEDAKRVERLSMYIIDFVAGVRRALDELDDRIVIPPAPKY